MCGMNMTAGTYKASPTDSGCTSCAAGKYSYSGGSICGPVSSGIQPYSRSFSFIHNVNRPFANRLLWCVKWRHVILSDLVSNGLLLPFGIGYILCVFSRLLWIFHWNGTKLFVVFRLPRCCSLSSSLFS
jgi:hypothetical protein